MASGKEQALGLDTCPGVKYNPWGDCGLIFEKLPLEEHADDFISFLTREIARSGAEARREHTEAVRVALACM